MINYRASSSDDPRLGLHAEEPRRTLLGERYALGRRIAGNRTNLVHLAADTQTSEILVVKTPVHGVCKPDSHSMDCWSLAAEGAMLRRLAYHQLVAPRFRDLIHEQGVTHLVMSYIPGVTLEDLAIQRQLDRRRILAVLIDICYLLNIVHGFGYVHHDLKPSNIIIRPDGQPVLIDWGAARRVGLLERRALLSLTPRYASPEQHLGITRFDNDSYALGIILAELIEQPGARLQAIIGRATAAAGQRYASVDDLRSALQRALLIERMRGLVRGAN